MPLPLTNLDDRRWAGLVDEGTALVPRYAPGWTDHNIHDPGRTLFELFAWLAEMSLYRLNRVPPRHRRKFLALLGFRAKPPLPARLALSFAPAAFLLPANTLFETEKGKDGLPVTFATERDLNVSVVTLTAVQIDLGDGALHDRTADWRDGLGIAVFGQYPHPGAALYLGFTDLAIQQRVAFALRFRGPGNDSAERDRILQEAAEQHEDCLHVQPDIHCPGEPPPPKRSVPVPPHHSAKVIWEVSTGMDAWLALQQVDWPAPPAPGEVTDDTRSLTLDGFVEINLAKCGQATVGEVTQNLFYLRCRLASGSYDAPPVLLDVTPNSVSAVQAVPVSQTFRIAGGVVPNGAPLPGQAARLTMTMEDGLINSLSFAAAGAPDLMVLSYTAPTAKPGELVLEMTLVGRGTGRPLPSLPLPEAPVAADSLRLFTHSGTVWQEWARHDDFDASTRADFHYVLDFTAGEVTFGDGERGRVPEERDLIAVVYRSTRGIAGNVAAGVKLHPSKALRNQVWLAGLPLAQLDKVKNRAPATGGASEEDITAVAGRAIETLHAHDRVLDLATEARSQSLDQIARSVVGALPTPGNAVNSLDIERLALAVPGTRVARAKACPGFDPDYPCAQAEGVVTVVIIPDLPVRRPTPSRGLIEAVKRFLDRRRIVGSRFAVTGPEYLEVHVEVSVRLVSGASRDRVRALIAAELDTFLDPRTGGPNGTGWPFGRTVYRTEILQLIGSTPGVEYVLSLGLRPGNGESNCGNLSLCPSWLVAAGSHRIEVL